MKNNTPLPPAPNLEAEPNLPPVYQSQVKRPAVGPLKDQDELTRETFAALGAAARQYADAVATAKAQGEDIPDFEATDAGKLAASVLRLLRKAR